MNHNTSNLKQRLAKLETALGSRLPARTVQRHVIGDETDAARQARIKDIVASSAGNVFHVFRVIVTPREGLMQ